MKLQKLVYYSQAWNLAWRSDELFPEDIQAWANGPVVYELFEEHRGRFTIEDWPHGDARHLTSEDCKVVNAVLAAYGDLSARKLSFLTHEEDPWRNARQGLSPTASSTNVISKEALEEYYGALDSQNAGTPVADFDWRIWEAEAPF